MTSYGTIPTDSSPPPSSTRSSIVRAKEWIQSNLREQRPWKDMIQPHSFNLPATLTHSINRIKTNVAFFRINYAIIVLSLLFLSLLWSPPSLLLLVVVVLLLLWLFLRDSPFMLFGRVVDNGVVMMVLLLAAVAVLFLTDVTNNIAVGLGVGVAVILAHGALRSTEDSFAGEEDGGAGSVH